MRPKKTMENAYKTQKSNIEKIIISEINNQLGSL